MEVGPNIGIPFLGRQQLCQASTRSPCRLDKVSGAGSKTNQKIHLLRSRILHQQKVTLHLYHLMI
jgi:hypothetical protein